MTYLKPCPVCGGVAVLIEACGEAWARCIEDCVSGRPHNTKAHATENWNSMPRRVDDITNKRMRFEAAVAAMQGLLAGNHQVTPWTTAVEAADALLAELAKTKETEIPGAPDVGALVAKRCHYCDALMRECEIEKDGVFVGVQYRCSAGCP